MDCGTGGGGRGGLHEGWLALPSATPSVWPAFVDRGRLCVLRSGAGKVQRVSVECRSHCSAAAAHCPPWPPFPCLRRQRLHMQSFPDGEVRRRHRRTWVSQGHVRTRRGASAAAALTRPSLQSSARGIHVFWSPTSVAGGRAGMGARAHAQSWPAADAARPRHDSSSQCSKRSTGAQRITRYAPPSLLCTSKALGSVCLGPRGAGGPGWGGHGGRNGG